MIESKEALIKAVEDLTKRMEKREETGDPTDKADIKKYEAALKEIADLKTKIKEMEDKTEEETEGKDWGDW